MEKRNMKKEFKDKLQENKQLEIEACKLVRKLHDTNNGVGLISKVYLAYKVVLNNITQKQAKENTQEYCNGVLENLEKFKHGNSENFEYMINSLKTILQYESVLNQIDVMDFMHRKTGCKTFKLMADIMYGNNIQYAFGAAFGRHNINSQIRNATWEIEKALKN